ncbi:amylo-alpha-1,6-glucosidase [Persicimonas caeni]|uniref:Amylo-alpha-1,6-glucosidase n=1 Tax=Persicimonas caeni TaxID=2292766 RepID=A0A4Y6Q129_PERCE|nr:amylo-alpha-1,6-glucosidase [Persicimonas caeni]QDG54190.1 amylo-alpha-1,6-glucosidase [Persicimonas caeni]QED35411.1 amylo-alpha-1,6-glucosidase [Persicimonas caeni]
MKEKDFHILTTNLLNTARTRVLKHSNLFAVFDEVGDIMSWGTGAHGLYNDDMRHLSKLELRLWGQKPILLSSTIKEDNALLTADLTNPELTEPDARVPSDTIHIHRSKFVTADTCHEKIRLHNYSDQHICVPLSVHFLADFADMFEIRGTEREARGEVLEPEVSDVDVVYAYDGLDDVRRLTRVTFVQRPTDLNEGHAYFEFEIAPHQRTELTYSVQCASHPQDDASQFYFARPAGYRQAHAELTNRLEDERVERCRLDTSNAFFNHLVTRADADLQMLITQTEHGDYPYAGTPWFNTIFGRDGLITAYQVLNINPQVARGVLGYLAATQADFSDAARDAEPGKILHEIRHDEMSNTGEVPFRHYYGSIDSTPLFISLAGAYLRRTNDTEFIKGIWPAIQNGIDWIDNHGDRDGDGYVEYGRRTAKGLRQQGWKDSDDSVFHADGRLADAPIALCEVQGYVYAARRAAAIVASTLGEDAYAEQQHREAEALRERFQKDFWDEELETFVLALDGEKNPCRVRSSNAGHCLLSGIASPRQAQLIARQLLSDDFYTGWGIRTIPSTEARYNPISYHNGSVWPHDNTMIAAGLARYGFKAEAARVLEGLYDASRYFELNRLPELFCGFERRPSEGPTLYPVACAPQAWAAGGVSLLIDSVLGLFIDGREGRIKLHNPRLPPFLETLRMHRLKVGDAEVDLLFERYQEDVGVQILRRRGKVEVMVVK